MKTVCGYQCISGLLDFHLPEFNADADFQIGCQQGHLVRPRFQFDARKGRFGTSLRHHSRSNLNSTSQCSAIANCFHVMSPKSERPAQGGQVCAGEVLLAAVPLLV
jgi:hypothetical protein